MSEALAYFRGRIVPLPEAKVSIMTHALHYGTAVFEGIRGNWNEGAGNTYIFRLREHITRLWNSARILSLEPPFGIDEMCDACVATVRANRLEQAQVLFQRDREYVLWRDGKVLDGRRRDPNAEVVIVDEFTGRLIHGRRYSEGLHQAIEAKEGVKGSRS